MWKFANKLISRQKSSKRLQRDAASSRDPLSGRMERAKRITLAVFTIGALTGLMAAHLRNGSVSLRLGQISPTEIRAGRSVFYVDSARTKRLQEAAMNAVPPVYDPDDRAATEAQRTMKQLFSQMQLERAELRANGPVTRKRLVLAMANSQFSSMLPTKALRRLLTDPAPVFQHLRNVTEMQVNSAMQRDIRNDGSDLRRVTREVQEYINNMLQSKSDRIVAMAVIQQSLLPNRILDKQKTEIAREAARRAQPPDVERVLAGDRILAAGERVNQQALDKLNALGLRSQKQELTTAVVTSLLAALMVLLVMGYLARNLPSLYRDTRRMALLSTIVLLGVLAIKAGAILLGFQITGGQLGYLSMTSVTAAGMLVCVLLDTNLAILIVALLALQSGLLMNFEIRFTVMTLMGGLVGVACANPARRRSNLPLVAAALAAVNISMVWLLGLLFSDTLHELLKGSMWAAGAAAMSLFLYWTGALALERPFGILTHSALLDLSAFDRPLLQRLCAVAPGTYAHSIMVGTLSESAAQVICADALLCRVAGYYHDIGKMNHPDFFVENQRHENVHTRLSPSLSALMIIGHVRDGIVLARENRLPQEICDIIAQHHGTTLIQYFYHRALADNAAGGCPSPGLEERFRYPGPKPQTREAAIVMLADSVEAATRSLDQPDRDQLANMVNTIVRCKIEDGQLDECGLTFRDARLISDAFIHVLGAMLHGRIAYPGPTSPEKIMSTATAAVRSAVSRGLQPGSSERADVDETITSGFPSYDAFPIEQGELPAPEAAYPAFPRFSADISYGNYDLQSTDSPGSNKTLETGSKQAAETGRKAQRRS